jgi:hypothetical protein
MVGAQAPVTQVGLNQNRDYPVLTDYRSLIGGVVRRAYEMTPARLDQVFPGAQPKDLGLI